MLSKKKAPEPQAVAPVPAAKGPGSKMGKKK